MARVSVQVGKDHLQKLAAPSPKLPGIRELIWNGLDADASTVAVSWTMSELGAVDEVLVVDNGHGMTFDEATRNFGTLGESWKRQKKESRNLGRRLHGSEGKGRWRAFSVGTLVTWESVAKVDEGFKRTVVSGNVETPNEFEIVDEGFAEGPAGTTVRIHNVRPESSSHIQALNVTDQLIADFALYLEKYTVAVSYGGVDLDPAALQANRTGYPLGVDSDFGEAHLEIIEWNRDLGRELLLCDENGMTLGDLPPGVKAPDFNFTAYIRWEGFRALEDELAGATMHPTLSPVIEAAKAQLRDHFRLRAELTRGAVIAEWKSQQVYPYSGEAASQVERAERELFDIIAVTAEKAVNGGGDTKAQKLSLRLLKQAVERGPAGLDTILQEVLDLPDDKIEELRQLLQRVSLSDIITTGKAVADRLDALTGIRALLFDKELKKEVLERTQLHRILAAESWVFGDEYTLSVDDESLTTVLKQHVKLLGREEMVDTDEEVLRADGSRGIVDMMFGRVIPLPIKQHEHLVVELKRPSQTITQKEVSQIESYAFAVADDERFDRATTRWNFWLIGTDLDKVARQKGNQTHLPPGVVHDGDGIRIWVKTWAEVLDDCEQRLKFVADKLEYQSSRDHAMDYLHRRHHEYLPAVASETAEPAQAAQE